jgi:broad specificity phosphatase PhoE
MDTEQRQIVLVRHGETEWSRSGRHTGRTDVALTDRGRAHAQSLRKGLGHLRFTVVLTSPLQRAAETARLAGFENSAEVVDQIREWDYGEYEGRTTASIREEIPEWSVWTHGVPGGETIDQVAARADSVIDRLRRESGDGIVFAHGHILRVLAARWCGFDSRAGRHLALDSATVSILGYERETPAIRLWNDAHHL